MSINYEADAARHTAIRDAQIPSVPSIGSIKIPRDPSKLYRLALSKKEIEIVELDVTGLAEAIAAARLTAIEVTEAYIKSAIVAHKGTNCLAWFDADLARDRAHWLDAQLRRTGTPVGPLHGVPISVKDFICVRGFVQSAGHLSSAGHLAAEDADIVAIFREAGVVYFAKTTQPQSIMQLETSNFLGTTTNAYSRDLTCGGSSGGEGALVGCHGSPMGITTDVGGSTRNPAALNGLWGFKPTTKRVPRDGMIGATSTTRIAGAAGPVCHSLRDMDLFYKTLFASPLARRDAKLVPMPWRHVDDLGKGAGYDGWSGLDGRLRIGVMRDDGFVRPVESISRAMRAILEKLSKHHRVELVEFCPIDVKETWDLTNRLYYTDGGAKLRQALDSEPMSPLTAWITSKVTSLSREEVDQFVARRNEIRQAYFDRVNVAHIDVILCPAGPAPAQPLGTTKYWSYTSMWNFLDWPAAVFPTGLFVQSHDDDTLLEPRNEEEKHLYNTYSASVAENSPIGLQMVAPRWQDERLMAALRVVDSVLPLT